MDGHNRDDGSHRRNIQRHENATAQFVAHAALRDECQSEAGLGQTLLRGQAVDQGDIGVVQPGADQLPRQYMTRRITFATRWREPDPAFARQQARIAHAAVGQSVARFRDHQHCFASGGQCVEFPLGRR